MKEEVSHALVFLFVALLSAVAWIALRSDRPALLGLPAGAAIILISLMGVGLACRVLAGIRFRERRPRNGMSWFEWTWLAYAVPIGICLAIPLVVAAELPDSWDSTVSSAQVLRVTLSVGLVEAIKLFAIDGKWLVNRMADDARRLIRQSFEDADLGTSTDGWLAVNVDDWQGGWGRDARALRAKALGLAFDEHIEP